MGFPSGTNAHPELFVGRIAVMMGGIWAEGWGKTVNEKLRLAFAPFPQVDDTHNACFTGFWAWAVNAKSAPERQAAGWKWIEFISNDTNAVRWFDEGGELQPRNIEGFAEHCIAKSPGLKVFINDAGRGKRPVQGPQVTEHWEVMRKMTEAIFKGGAKPADAVESAWKAMQEIG